MGVQFDGWMGEQGGAGVKPGLRYCMVESIMISKWKGQTLESNFYIERLFNFNFPYSDLIFVADLF